MNKGGALCILAAFLSIAATRSIALPPPPPGGSYVYENTTPGTVLPSGQLVDQSTSSITVTSATGGGPTTIGTLTSRVYREDTGTLDFVYHVTPLTTGITLHSLDVPWINNEVTLNTTGFSTTALNEVAPDYIARFYDYSPITFLFDIRNLMAGGNLDAGTTDLVLITDAHAYTTSNAFTARTVDPTFTFSTSESLDGLIPEHAPEPASLGILAVGGLLLARRHRRPS